jgi:tRNA pseudouridine32 synthase / 23S rRNA pseudouridine746 synthase
MTLDIVYEDADLLAVNKPAGLLSVPGKVPLPSLLAAVQAYNPNSRLVHRLDMATSGLIVFAKHHAAQRQLGLDFEHKRLQKQYFAWVVGQPAAAEGIIDLPLICDWPARPRQKVCHETGRPAQTRYSCIKALTDASLVALWPVTGRSHQLRVHLQSLGHPILGDRLYHPAFIDADQAPGQPDRLLLHSYRLTLLHPLTRSPLQLEAPVPFSLEAPYAMPTL